MFMYSSSITCTVHVQYVIHVMVHVQLHSTYTCTFHVNFLVHTFNHVLDADCLPSATSLTDEGNE